MLLVHLLQVRGTRHAGAGGAGVGIGPGQRFAAGVVRILARVRSRCRRRGLGQGLRLGLIRLPLARAAVQVAPRRAEGGDRAGGPDGRDGVLISLVGPGGLDRPIGPDGHVVALILAVVGRTAVEEAVGGGRVVIAVGAGVGAGAGV